jgi:transposase
MGGNRPFALVNERDRLLERIAQQPDLPLRALLAELGSRGIKVSYFALWNIVDRANLSFKKACAPANKTARRSREGICDGTDGRARLIPSALFSLTKPRRRRT